MSELELLKTPLHDWHAAHGGRLVDFGGWAMPVQYAAGILQEHLATRRAGGLFDVSHMGRFRIAGTDRVAFLQHVLTSNVDALLPGQAQYTLLANERGGVIDDAYLYCWTRDEFGLVVNAANRLLDWTHLRAQAQRFGNLVLEDQTDSLAMIALQGPLAADLLGRLVGQNALPEARHNRLSETALKGSRLRIARTGYTGEPIGFELFLPGGDVVWLWQQLLDMGRERGVLPVGLGARDTLRLEAGMPLYGHEFGVDSEGREIPAFAVPLVSVAVSFDGRKGPFVGRAALERQFEQVRRIRQGCYTPSPLLRRRVLPLAILDKGIARHGDAVFVGDMKIGVITSGTSVPFWIVEGSGETGRRSIALAYVDAEFSAGQDVAVLVRDRRLAGRLVKRHGRSDEPPNFRTILASAL